MEKTARISPENARRNRPDVIRNSQVFISQTEQPSQITETATKPDNNRRPPQGTRKKHHSTFSTRETADVEDFKAHYTPPKYDPEEVQWAINKSSQYLKKDWNEITSTDIEQRINAINAMIRKKGKKNLTNKEITTITIEQRFLNIAISQKVEREFHFNFYMQSDRIAQNIAQE
ncbi:MAG TPA: hypothetical protein VL461_09555 [Dictyobacter sp.]|nr:hypothetical protein [Dictyobacter sp.]